jgi:hypothetical protein
MQILANYNDFSIGFPIFSTTETSFLLMNSVTFVRINLSPLCCAFIVKDIPY